MEIMKKLRKGKIEVAKGMVCLPNERYLRWIAEVAIANRMMYPTNYLFIHQTIYAPSNTS